MPHLNRDGVKIYYEDHGKGLPILWTHGFGASTGMWKGEVEAFRASYRLIPWDMRGHGQSDSPENQALYSQDLALEDMRGILDHLKIDRAVLAGHSLGGFLSLAFHVKYPNRVRALILQGCGPGFRKAEPRDAWNAMAAKRAQTIEEKGLQALGGGSEARLSTHRSAAGLARAARGILTQTDARVIDSLPQIAVPALVIVGDGDTAFLAGSDYMASRIPGAQKKLVAKSGHAPNVDQPQVFREAVSEFLKKLS